MVRTKIIRKKTYKYGGKYSDRRTALIRAKTVRSRGDNATVLKENGLYVVWTRSKVSYY